MTKDIKLILYPMVVAAIGLGLVALLWSRLNVSVWVEETPPETVSSSELDESLPSSPTQLLPSPSPSSIPSPSEAIASPVIPTTPPSTEVIPVHQGSLRVWNQTEHPLRVALLPQQNFQAESTSIVDTPGQPGYGETAHWDFAPQEGRARGLILSLPDDSLQLQEGDILVAFAQDGSRRYWGPYVVGQTPVPTWDEATTEWHLILKP